MDENKPDGAPIRFDTHVYQWTPRRGKSCPDCGEPIRWKHDGYLWHGSCAASCEMQHFSTEERVWE